MKKSKEHIIPNWLINLVNPEIKALPFFPFLNRETGNYEEKAIPWAAIAFPACEECNLYYGRLEDHAKGIIEALLSGEDVLIGVEPLTTLFDWLSKMRMGMWFAYMYYLELPLEEGSNAAIGKRMHMHDRLAVIYKLRTDLKGIHFTGPGIPAFQALPTIFGMRINDYYFVNMATVSLVSKNLGFPYVKRIKLGENAEPEIIRGSEKVSPPILEHLHGDIIDHSIKLYQPMYGMENDLFPEAYVSDYIKDNSMFDGVGKIYIDNNQSVERLEKGPDYPLPVTVIEDNIWEFFQNMFIEILGLYIQDLNNLISMTEFTEVSQGAKLFLEASLGQTENYHYWAQTNKLDTPQ